MKLKFFKTVTTIAAGPAATCLAIILVFLTGHCFENTTKESESRDPFVVKRYNIRMQQSRIFEKLEVGHRNQFRVVINSEEEEPVADVPVNLYIVSETSGDGTKPEQHFLGTTHISVVNPGEHIYYVSLDVTDLPAQTGNYTLTGHVCWGDEGEIFNAAAKSEENEITGKNVSLFSTKDYSLDDKAELWEKLKTEVKTSQSTAEVDMSATGSPDLEIKQFSIIQAEDDPSTQPTFVVFKDVNGYSGNPEESSLQQINARLELYVHAADLQDVAVKFKLVSQDSAVNDYLDVYDVASKQFVKTLQFESLRAYNKYAFSVIFKVDSSLYQQVIDHVKFFDDEYPFIIQVEVAAPGEDEKYSENNVQSTPLTVIPAPDVVVPQGDELSIEYKWEKMFKKGKFGVGYSLGYRGSVVAKEDEDIDKVVIAASAEAWGQIPILLPLVCSNDTDYLYALDLRAYLNTDRDVYKIDLGNNYAETYLKVFNKKVFGFAPPKDSMYPSGITPPEPDEDSWATRFHKGDTLYKWNREILSYSWPIPVGPVIIFAGITVYAEFGFSLFLGNVFDFTIEAIPYFTGGLVAFGYVGYDDLGLAAGVVCDVALMTAYCRAAGWFRPHIQPNGDTLYLLAEMGERIDVGVQGPKGEFLTYLKFPFLKFCSKDILGVTIKYPCGFETKELQFSFCKWGPAFERTAEIQKGVTSLTMPLCPATSVE